MVLMGRVKMRAQSSGHGATVGRSGLAHPLIKPVVFIMGLLPLALLFWGALNQDLGANPAERLIRETGIWTLRFLCLTLAITPVRLWLRQPAWARLRRMLGLYTFFYGGLHFMAYAWLDRGFIWPDISSDIVKRPFILIGVCALLTMLPLAATSFNRAIKALGAARWQALHRLVYATAVLGLLHFFWLRAAKHRYDEVIVYVVIIGVLLAARVLHKAPWRRLRRHP